MKKLRAILIGVICICLIHTASAEANFWTEGTMEYHGHIISIHAIVHDTLPSELFQIKMQGSSIKKNVLHQTLEKHFTLHPELSPKNSQVIDDFYISEWAYGYSAVAGYDARLITNDEVEQLFPVEEPELCLLYEKCIAFLADLGITAAEDTGYICRQNQKGNDYIIALLPYQIEGLTTEYKNQIVNRDSLQYSSKTGQHIMDYPWADFVFDCEGQLLKVEMSSFQVSSSKVLNGQPISWEQAAENVLDAIIDTQVSWKKSLENKENYSEDQFWRDYDVQLARVTPMWMPNWLNVCLPGWCIQYQLYDHTTGDFLYSMAYCADALTGEVAYYHPD